MNPDGAFNFVWGDSRGGWVKFPVRDWYLGWLGPTVLWLLLVRFVANEPRRLAESMRDWAQSFVRIVLPVPVPAEARVSPTRKG